MAIKLNDSQYELSNVKVFNNGKAGIVYECKVRLESRKPSDPDNMPKFKLILTDANGGDINKGYFGNFDKASDAALTFFVKEMKHLAGIFGVTLPEEFNSYDELLAVTMKMCYEKQAETVVNVFVDYGTKDRPSKYLNIASAFSITKSTETPWMNPKACLERLAESSAADVQAATAASSDGLPF